MRRSDFSDMLLMHSFARSNPDVFGAIHALFDIDICEPTFVPPHFVPGPVFIGFGSDMDCDGRSDYALRIHAPNLAAADDAVFEQWGGMTADGVHTIMTVQEARNELSAAALDKVLYDDHGYTSEFHLSAVGRDDSLGTIFDHTYDECEVA